MFALVKAEGYSRVLSAPECEADQRAFVWLCASQCPQRTNAALCGEFLCVSWDRLQGFSSPGLLWPESSFSAKSCGRSTPVRLSYAPAWMKGQGWDCLPRSHLERLRFPWLWARRVWSHRASRTSGSHSSRYLLCSCSRFRWGPQELRRQACHSLFWLCLASDRSTSWRSQSQWVWCALLCLEGCFQA